ncbi:ATP-binding cassette, subfamily C, CydD/ATP-binding cassette, subfamily C, CydCD [Selenomonas ruminantium]|uniref:ATP-binding cassette, subfamily C, CydD/ATP-binding cassette, subfamily C, CydCD n=1 Tax=Selenomonas ruminantium TaxID=971 RepID=A0A1M6SD28_SELRU|nr:thiol reductant ABC exporter subunit CydD [Selenomonas ruminantium]SHK42643.1 ATP-binding cassette, subfamily C, CydD/ATP-binding cassette, subfamily C, CydCD [Selenomonas ruminantium]
MIPLRFRLYFQHQKKILLGLWGWQLAAVMLYTAAMNALSWCVDAVFLEQKTLIQAAPVLLVLLFLLIFWEITRYLQKQAQHRASLHIRHKLRQKLHRQLLAAPQTAAHSPRLLTLACENTEAVDDDWQVIIPALISLLTIIPFLLLVFACSDIITAAICLATIPIAPFLLYLLSSLTQNRSTRAWENLAQLTQGFHELLRALPLLKIFQQDKAQRLTAQKLLHDFSTATLKVLELAFLASFVLELITTLAIALIAVTIGLRLLHGELTFQTGFFILLLLPEFYQPLRQSGIAFHAAMNGNTAAARIEQALTAASCPSPQGHHESLRIPPAITIQDLQFTYPQRHTPALNHLSLHFPAGRITLLTGSSGCGKSTLLTLLSGIYPPDSGQILLKDQPLPTMHPDSRAKLIGWLPQEPHLYQGTLAQNLLLFQNAPDERCLQALRLTQLEDFYTSLPDGLDTLLGDGGQKLSQGQLKRLGLARLILQNNPILLLDEPTTGLDEETEQRVIRTISVLAKRRTVIISSHHPALQEIADKIINLNDYLPKEGD